MTVYVFVGPTLSAGVVQSELDAVCLPPAAGGDLYRAARAKPEAIGLIDGYFEHTPAVWHKEILWAMAEGVHVFGAAAIGALRAAELAPFGMEGVGTIFESFRDGVLENDDEVAIKHAGADQGYKPLSQAMINVRATLAAAEEASILAPATRMVLEQIMEDLFYPRRSYRLMFECAADMGAPAKELEALRAWLPSGQVDRMRSDAVDMLRLIRERLRVGLQPKVVHFRLEQTEYWDRIQRRTSVAACSPVAQDPSISRHP